MMLRGLFACLGLLALFGANVDPSWASPNAPIAWQIAAAPDDEAALATATSQLCNRQVAMLGEASHGDGHTDAFKVALIERLVRRCGYRAVFFEASFYEFVPIARARRQGAPVTPGMIATAIGGLWKFDREFQALLPFLAQGVNDGRLTVGGIDFQTGGLDQDYSNEGFVNELTAGLDPVQAESCKSLARDRLYTGLAPERQQEAARCLAAIARNLPPGNRQEADERRLMLANLEMAFATDPANRRADYIADRDRQMYVNFQRLKQRMAPDTKIIVWSATAHIANGADELPDFAGIGNFGSYIHRRYGNRVFALGFSALAGNQRWGRTVRVLPDAPSDSLETLAMSGTAANAVFLDQGDLRRAGAAPAAAFNHLYHRARWGERLDGMIVFREEHAAESLRH
ncbi:MAG: erythromycin esterase family protein [Pseudomonadota bacterium]